ncbi:DNA topoisomerase I [Archaeoglobus sulfaticallidus PM70-1]|uniref:DNA topoisomerase 1 n=1 Tax=Archaeoglobus sulfaticallidus PM70-1 TaxID=387631 RepID=N0BE99_9EURY|nr:DNA topoisomerase I [Archaeoglobus sulfaticallidus]AGK60547.1 DNA topoisomerase I [Archaeoglobus sulfaticallidus PM70-1]
MAGKWLIITEKDNTARRISSILFKNVKKVRKKGINVYQADNTYVIGLKGHIVQLDFPEEYNNWSKVPLKSLLRADIIKKVTEKNLVEVLKSIAKEIDRVTIATDYDREGELIGVEALEIIRNENPNVRFDRVRYSAITPSDIKKAFSSPTEVDFNLAKSAEIRQKIDLIWGAVLTRLISLSSGRLGKDFLSVGRVQSPTLRLIVEREEEIKNFKPKKYWEIFASFRKGEEVFQCKHEKRFEDKEQAEKAFAKVGDKGVVVSFEKKERAEKPPTPFNTTEFLREASKFMSVNKAMMVAESLYMSGYISYPRTDNTVYPKTINLRAIVEKLTQGEFKKEAEFVLSQEKLRATRGKKESKDHPPIHPTAVAKKDELSKDEWVIYELVVRRFLATLSPDAIWVVRRGKIDSSGEIFRFNGRKLIEEGWRKIYIYSKAEEVPVPDLQEGEVLDIVSKKLEEKETKPPNRYSSGSLIKEMEKLGLGTKSTRHEIINKLYSRKYVYGNPLRPSEIGMAVINALKKEAETITQPDMTSKLEEDMYAIAEGKLSDEYVVEESIRFLDEILSNLDRESLSKTLRDGIRKDKIVGKCPKCSRDLVIRKKKGDSRRFIGCSGYPDCNFTLPLPQKGTIYITSKLCEKHEIKRIKIRTKKGYWDLGCPYCNYLEWQEKNKKVN